MPDPTQGGIPPEALQGLFARAQKYRAEGKSTEWINARLAAATRGLVPSMVALAEQMAHAGRQAGDVPPMTTAQGATQVGQGVTSGFLDELAGAASGAATLVGSAGGVVPAAQASDDLVSRYKQARDMLRAFDTRTRQEHPVASEIARGTGALIQAAPLMGVSGLTVPARIALAGGVGAAGGALAGAGDAPTMEEVPQEAARGGAVGGIAGVGLGAVGEAAGGLMRLTRAMAPSIIGKFAPVTAGRMRAAAALRNSARRAALGVPEARDTWLEMERLRPGLPVGADVAPQFGGNVRTIFNEGAGNIRELKQRLYDRVAGAPSRLAADLRRLSGVGARNIEQAREMADGQLRTIGTRLFQPFEHQFSTMPITPELKTFLASPDIAPLWARVRPRAGLQGQQAVQKMIDAGIPEQLARTTLEQRGVPMPGYQHFRDLRRLIQDAAGTAQRSGATGMAREMRAAETRLVDELENILPGLRATNREYAQAASVTRAFDRGTEAVRGRKLPEELAMELDAVAADAGPYRQEAIEAFRHGAIDNTLRDMFAANPTGDVGHHFADVAAELFPSRKAFEQWTERALVEGTFHDLLKEAVGNSTTAAQLSELTRGTTPRNVVFNWLRGISPEQAHARASRLTELLLTPGEHARADFLRVLAVPSTAIGSPARSAVAGAAAGSVASDLRSSASPETKAAVDAEVIPPTSFSGWQEGLKSMMSLDRGAESGKGMAIPEALLGLTMVPGALQAGRDVTRDVRGGTVGPMTGLSAVGALAGLPFLARIARVGRLGSAVREEAFPARAAIRTAEGRILTGAHHFQIVPELTPEELRFAEEGFVDARGVMRGNEPPPPESWMTREQAERAASQAENAAPQGMTSEDLNAGSYRMQDEHARAQMNHTRHDQGLPPLSRQAFVNTVLRPRTLDAYPRRGNVIDALRARDDWAILSAENPSGAVLSAEENATRTANLRRALTKAGYHPTPVRGNYGRDENSFLVLGIPKDDAVALAREYGQESVATRDALLYADGRSAPRTSEWSPTNRNEYFSELDVRGQRLRFAADFNFDAPSAQPAAAANPNTQMGTGRFYSRLQRAVDGARLQKGTPDEWRAYLRNQPMPAEERDMVLADAFEGISPKQKLTREEMSRAVSESGIRLQETVRETADPALVLRRNQLTQRHEQVLREMNLLRSAYEPQTRRQQGDLFLDTPELRVVAYHDRMRQLTTEQGTLEAEMQRIGPNPRAPAYTKWTEPGGTNDREIIVSRDTPLSRQQVQLDRERVRVLKELNAIEPSWRQADIQWRQDPNAATEARRAPVAAKIDELDALNDRVDALMVRGAPYTSPHWPGEDNPVIHMRLTDRTIDGKKVLFVEEIQSDLHQAGREQGYRPTRPTYAAYTQADGNGGGHELIGRFPTEEEALAALPVGENGFHRGSVTAEHTGNDRPPETPFKKTEDWAGLAWRRVMDEAVRGGYDRVAWTTGEQQNRRYGLSQIADELAYDPEEVGGYLRTYKDGRLVDARSAAPEELPALIGKENAVRLLAQPVLPRQNNAGVRTMRGGMHVLRGENFEVGGEGMRTFYDRMLPNVVSAWAKKRGLNVPVQQHAPGPQPHTEHVAGATFHPNTVRVTTEGNALNGTQYIDITPALRDNIRTQGQELYGATPIVGAAAGAAAGSQGDEEQDSGTRARNMSLGAAAGALGVRGSRLLPDELRTLGRVRAPAILRDYDAMTEVLPSAHELTSAALAGRVRRNWYKGGAQSIVEAFGAEAPRFAAFLAAASPQQSVESNLDMAIAGWTAWKNAGMPRDPAVVRGLIAPIDLIKTRTPNMVRALTTLDPGSFLLSGPKVFSFHRNLLGDTNRLTLDTHMGSLAGVNPEKLRGAYDATLRDPIGQVAGPGGGYLAYTQRMREATDLLNATPGAGKWTPDQTQAAAWSWTQPVVQSQQPVQGRAAIYSGMRSMDDMLGDPRNAVPIDVMRDTPDFTTLLQQRGEQLRAAGANTPTTNMPASRPADPRLIDPADLGELLLRIQRSVKGNFLF